MQTWYRTTRYHFHMNDRIQKVEVLRDTANFVVVLNGQGEEQRHAKTSSDQRHWRTWAEAHAYLLDRSRRNVEILRKRLAGAEADLADVEAMRPPHE